MSEISVRPLGPLDDLVLLLGRLAVSGLFLGAAVEKLAAWQENLRYIREGSDLEELADPALFLVAAVVLLGIGGASVLVGGLTRVGVVLLAVFLVAASVAFHPFWQLDPDDPMFKQQQIDFVKNGAILGGLAFLFVAGPGRISVDARRRPRKSRAGETG